MKNELKKAVVLVVMALVFLIVVVFTGVRDFSNTYALSYEKTFNLYIPENTTAVPGDKVYVELEGADDWDYVHLNLVSSSSGDTFDVYLKDVHSKEGKPYFILPKDDDNSVSSSKKGVIVGETYELKNVDYSSMKCSEDHKCDSKFGVYDVSLAGNKKYVKVVEDKNKVETKSKVDKFVLKDTLIHPKDKAYVTFEYTGQVDKAIIYCMGSNYNSYLSVEIHDFDSEKPYISGSDFVLPDVYTITAVSLYNSNSTENGGYVTTFSNYGTLVVVNNQNDKEEDGFKLVEINLNTYEAKVGDKVYVDINANKNIKSALLVFYDKEKNQSISAYVKNFMGHPYFMLPSISNVGNYRLQKVVIKDADGNSQVTEVPQFDGKTYTDENGVFYETIEFKVVEDNLKDRKSLVFNNENYDDLMAKKIDELDDTAVITVVCDNYTLVKGSLFSQIAETRKTLILQYGLFEWVFNGTDIVNPKFVDVSMLLSSINKSDFSKSNISSQLSDSDVSILNFANNGELPGKVLIRLNSVELDPKFGNKDIFVYYYNDTNNSLMKVALEVQKIEGYYEFYINHNSIYVLSSKKISDKLVSEDNTYLNLNGDNKDLETNNENNNNYILYSIICACGIIIVILLAIILKNRKK